MREIKICHYIYISAKLPILSLDIKALQESEEVDLKKKKFLQVSSIEISHKICLTSSLELRAVFPLGDASKICSHSSPNF